LFLDCSAEVLSARFSWYGGEEPGVVVVELSDGEGRRLLVRLASGESLDVPTLVEAFRRHRS